MRPGASRKSKDARLKSEAAATEATAKARDAPLGMTMLRRGDGQGGAPLRARRMAQNTPSMFAGHSMLCPYDYDGKGAAPLLARRMADAAPSMFAGHD